MVKEQLQDMYSDSMESLFDSKSPPGASDIAGLHVQSPFTLESSLPRTFTTGCGRGKEGAGEEKQKDGDGTGE